MKTRKRHSMPVCMCVYKKNMFIHTSVYVCIADSQ